MVRYDSTLRLYKMTLRVTKYLNIYQGSTVVGTLLFKLSSMYKILFVCNMNETKRINNAKNKANTNTKRIMLIDRKHITLQNRSKMINTKITLT